MSNKVLVSCVIIFLSIEKFVLEALESVFAQTYDNWELFLILKGGQAAKAAQSSCCVLTIAEWRRRR